jgi:hypothetical protein
VVGAAAAAVVGFAAAGGCVGAAAGGVVGAGAGALGEQAASKVAALARPSTRRQVRRVTGRALEGVMLSCPSRGLGTLHLMPRPHIEFVQQQDLPFEPASNGTEVKLLSLDNETGACSSLVRYPAGWRRPGPIHFVADDEFYVLSGDLTISDIGYTEHCYGFLPTGYTQTGAYSEGGALVMRWLSAGGAPVPGAGVHDDSRVVRCLNMFEQPWTGNFHPQFPLGAGRKWLRRDPLTTDETWILGTLPLRNGRRPEKHPVVEEMYLISGELIGPQGVMRPGAYFWRPPEVWHGPYGSKTGCLMLFRTVGGPLSTIYTEDEQDFEWNPEGYRPILPPELTALVAARA